MQTFAVRKGDTFILNGSKRFITNGGLAQVNSVSANTELTCARPPFVMKRFDPFRMNVSPLRTANVCIDRKSVVKGKSEDHGGRRRSKKKRIEELGDTEKQ